MDNILVRNILIPNKVRGHHWWLISAEAYEIH